MTRVDSDDEALRCSHAAVEFFRDAGTRLNEAGLRCVEALELLDGLDSQLSGALDDHLLRETLGSWPKKVRRSSRSARKAIDSGVAACLRRASEIEDLLQAMVRELE